MTYVVAVLNQKGGSGKTTVAVNLAHALKLQGEEVTLVDSDPQGSARDWNESNDGEVVAVIGLDRSSLPRDIEAVKKGKDWIIIDGAPQIEKLSAAAVKAADMVVIPCQPSPYDIWAAADLVELIKARQDVTNGKPKAAFVVSRKIRGTKLGNEIKLALQEYGLPIFESSTTQRVAYPTTANEGQTVLIEPDSPAATEINQLMNEIKEFRHGS